MAHLKKLSQVLNKIKPPKIYPISLIHSDATLESPAFRFSTITKLMKAHEIPSLLLSAENFGLVSLSSNQLKFNSSFFAIHNSIEQNKWTDYTGPDYKVFINPLIIDISEEVTSGFEECPSLPYLQCQVERNKSILLEYMNIEGEYIQEEFHDFKARVIQHEVDHLFGYLVTQFCTSFGRIQSKDPSKTKNILKVLLENEQVILEAIKRHENKTIPIGEKKAEVSFKKERQFIEKIITDPEFEEEFREILYPAFEEDYFNNQNNSK